MASKSDDSFDPAQPALIVTYGNTARKHRPLNRPVLVLGQARGCDIGLVAPDVSNVHCVIVRNPDGFLLRDCASRSGTRLNGETVTAAMLHDSDILQVGPFSFQVYLPGLPPLLAAEAPNPERVRRLERSRRNLARLALAQRRSLREQKRNNLDSEAEQAARQIDLDRQEASLREQMRDLEQRCRQLAQAERDLSCDRETLDQEFAALQLRLQQGEQELASRQAEVESDIRTRWEQFQTRLSEEEEQRRKGEVTASPSGESLRLLEIRQKELEHLAAHLRRERQRMRGQEEQARLALQQLTCAAEEVQQEQKVRIEECEVHQQEQAAAAVRLSQQREGILRAEAALHEQRSELVRMMAELKQMHDAARNRDNTELAALRQQNDQLRQLLAGRELPEPCTGKDAATGPLAQELEQLHDQVAELGRQLAEKDALIGQLRQGQATAAPPAPPVDPDGYEAELTRFRLQLERERQAFDEEVRQLRVRTAELDQATREMEVDLSRDRAELARERIRLEQLREELRLDLERSQRDAEIRERLAPLQRLKGELAARPHNGDTQLPNPNGRLEGAAV